MPVAGRAASSLVDQIARPNADPRSIASRLSRTDADLSPVLVALSDSRARARHGCAKVLVLLSEIDPERVYPHWDAIVEMLDNENKIMCWTAMKILANLAVADSQGRIERILPRILSLIDGPVMITAANAIQAAAKIAQARPDLAEKIAKGILGVEKARYQTEECRNIAIGHALAALAQIPRAPLPGTKLIDFVRRHITNPRPSTRRKAETLLKTLSH